MYLISLCVHASGDLVVILTNLWNVVGQLYDCQVVSRDLERLELDNHTRRRLLQLMYRIRILFVHAVLFLTLANFHQITFDILTSSL